MTRYKLNAQGRKESDCGFVTSSFTFVDSKVACVAVKITEDGISVRDTKDMSDITLNFTVEEWQAFVDGVKAKEFDV